MTRTIDPTDTRRMLIQSTTSGEQFIVEEASLWDDDHCVGSLIIRASDAIYYGDLPEDVAETDLDDWNLDNDVDEDEWFNAGAAIRVLKAALNG